MIVVKYSLRCRSSVHNNNNSLQDQDLDEEDSRFGLDKGDDEEEDEEEKRLREYQEENPPKKFKALFQTASAEVNEGDLGDGRVLGDLTDVRSYFESLCG